MKRTALATSFRVAVVAAALAMLPSGTTAFGEASHATVAVERRTEASPSPALGELYQSVLSFEPGAWTAVHAHNGGSYNTVIEGQVTLRIGDTDRTFGPGEGWTDEPGVLHVAGNAGSTGEARLIASMVVDRGMPPVTVIEPEDEDSAPPPPEFVAMTKAVAALPAGPLDVVEQTMDLDADTRVVLPAPLGPRLVGVLDGTVTVEIDGASRTVEAGEGWTESPDHTYAYTVGEGGAQIALTSMVPHEAPVAATAGQ